MRKVIVDTIGLSVHTWGTALISIQAGPNFADTPVQSYLILDLHTGFSWVALLDPAGRVEDYTQYTFSTLHKRIHALYQSCTVVQRMWNLYVNSRNSLSQLEIQGEKDYYIYMIGSFS